MTRDELHPCGGTAADGPASSADGAVVMAIFFLIFDVWFRALLARGSFDVLSLTQGQP